MNTAIPIAAVLIVSGSFLRLPVGCGAGRLEREFAQGLAFLHGDFRRGLIISGAGDPAMDRKSVHGAAPPPHRRRGTGPPGLEDLRLSL